MIVIRKNNEKGVRGLESKDKISKNIHIHCEECKKPVPFHLLRGKFHEIIESKAVFKLIITGKNVGKTTNLILFQMGYMMNHEFGDFVGTFRNEEDKLEKGKNMGIICIQKIMPKKLLEEFNEKDGKDSRGEVASGNGVRYKGRLRVRFCSLQHYEKTDSSFGRDAVHFVFDEAMPSDGKELTSPNEEYRGHQVFHNVMSHEDEPTQCYFLCNPHTKGSWLLKYFCKEGGVEKAFNEDAEEHYFEDYIPIDDDGIEKKVLSLLYQTIERKGKNTYLLNLIKGNEMRRAKGIFDKSEEKYIRPRPQGNKVDRLQPIMIVKGCIYSRLKWSSSPKFYIYLKSDNEILPKSIIHLCFSREEHLNSPYKNKVLVDKPKDLKEGVDVLFWGIESGILGFCNSKDSKFPDVYQAKKIMFPGIYQFDKDKKVSKGEIKNVE